MQDFENRNHITAYRSVALVESVVGEGRNARNTKTELVLNISNWHFNRQAQRDPDEMRCSLTDCNVTLKYSSSEFAIPGQKGYRKGKRNDGGGYIWDKAGLTLSYPSFVHLMSDKYLTQTFMQDVRRKYEEKQGSLLASREVDEDWERSWRGQGPAEAVGGPGSKGGPAKRVTGTKRARFPAEEEEEEEASASEEVEEVEAGGKTRKRGAKNV